MSSRRELANAIRALSRDAVQKANSGHPGAPMGMADIAEVLWNDFMKHNPGNPKWADRDRFVLSNGHGSHHVGLVGQGGRRATITPGLFIGKRIYSLQSAAAIFRNASLTTGHYTLTISCPDRAGIIAAVSGFIAQHGGFIVEASYHTEQEAQHFFMRQEIRADSLPFDADEFRRRFAALANKFRMVWQLSDSAIKKRLVVLLSKQDHCLDDLLHRWRSGELEVDIPCVISNHNDLRSFVEWHGIPFHHVNMSDKQAAFAEIERLFDYRGETLVLARFMQIGTFSLFPFPGSAG